MRNSLDGPLRNPASEGSRKFEIIFPGIRGWKSATWDRTAWRRREEFSVKG
jgi:hypothetical protein